MNLITLPQGLRNLFNRWQWKPINQIRYGFVPYGTNEPVLINTDDLFRAVIDCPHLALVINKIGEMAQNGDFKIADLKDDEKFYDDDPILSLLTKPNALQYSEHFLYQYFVLNAIWHNTFIYKLRATTASPPVALTILPSGCMKIKFTGKYYNQTKIDGIVKEYLLNEKNKDTPFKVDEIIWKAQNRGEDLVGQSKIPSLRYPISNIVAALKTRNITIVDKGIVGFIAMAAPKDNSGVLPIDPDERERFEKTFADDVNLYSNKPKIKITTNQMTWEDMGKDVRSLGLFEEVEEDFQTIIGAYGLKRDLFPSTKGATFENDKQAEKSSYVNAIIPIADDLARTLSDELGLTARGRKIVIDYSWLPCMQQNKQEEEQAEKTKVERLAILFDKKIISAETFAEMADVEFTGTGEVEAPKPLSVVNAAA